MTSTVRRLIDSLYPSPKTPKILILGLDWSGKTTLLYLLKLGEIVPTVSSIGFNVETVDVPTASGRTFRMTAWDVGSGCATLRHMLGLVRLYIEYSEAIIWVVDASDRERLSESVETLGDILTLVDQEAGLEKSPAKIPILILVNKSDKPNPLSVDDIRIAFSKITSGRLVSAYKSSLTQESCSNLNASGLPEAFDWLHVALGISKSIKESKPPSSSSNPQINQRAPNVLANKLESWLTRSENDISANDFLEKFSSYDLPHWDHYTHIRLAYLMLTKYGRQEGKEMIFKGLAAYIDNSNQAKGKAFHLTMTYFWIQIVHLGIRNTPPATLSSNQASLNEFARFLLVNPHVVDGNLWSDFYSKDVLMSQEAKTVMVLPDKKPLPNLATRDAITSFGA